PSRGAGSVRYVIPGLPCVQYVKQSFALTSVHPAFTMVLRCSSERTGGAVYERREVWREGVGVALATSAYGISFGALAVTSGLDVWQTCVLSVLMFTGGSQFAFVGVLGAGGMAALPSAIASAVLLGVRNLAYGMRMSPIIGSGFWRRSAAAHVTID